MQIERAVEILLKENCVEKFILNIEAMVFDILSCYLLDSKRRGPKDFHIHT